MLRMPDPARSRAVLIGTASYTASEQLPAVRAIPNNVGDFRTLLVEGEPGAFTAEHTRTILDPGTPRELGAPLLEAAREAEDVLLVYYAGHGLIGHERRDLYLGLTGADPEAPSFTAFPFDGVREAFLSSRARIRVLILDCCFSGRAISGGLSGAGEPLIDRMEISGTYTLASAPANEPARFAKGERHTAFTGELLRALRDGFDTAPAGGVTLGSLYRHLRAQLPSKGWPEPQHCGTETAQYLVLSRPRRARAGVSTGGTVPEHERLLRLSEEGRRLGEAGHAADAVTVLGGVLGDLARAVGPEHRDTLTGQISLAHWMGNAGQVQQALSLSRTAVDDLTRVLGPEDRATLVGRAQIALWTGEAGDAPGALRLSNSVEADFTRALGPRDRDTLIGRGLVVRWTGESGDPGTAVRLGEELLPQLAAALGPEDRETLVSRINQAQWVGRAGRAGTAVRQLRQVVPDLRWILGSDDMYTLVGRARLGQWSGAAGSPRKAVGLYRAVIPDLQRVFGSEARETLLARSQYAHWVGEGGDPRAAVELISALLPDLIWVLGPDDRVTLVNRARLAHWSGLAGDVGEAVRKLNEVMADLRRVLGPDDAETLADQQLLARWRRRADRRLKKEIFYGTGGAPL